MTWTPYSDSLSLGLRIFVLNPPFPISRRLILQQARGQVLFPPTACQHTVSCSISLPLRGFSFNFPSLYYFAIGHLGVFSLTRWSSLIHTGFHVSHATRDKQKFILIFWLLDFHHLWCRFQLLRLNSRWIFKLFSHDPKLKTWFRLFPFRSPLLRESRLLSFPSATKMFQFTELPHSNLWIQLEVQEVALFGNLRIIACFQLPEAFRRFHALHRL